MTIAALVLALAVLAGLAVMQVLIIMGKPVGEYAWGGQNRVPTPRVRKASVAAIALCVAFALLLMSRAGVLPGGSTLVIVVATWVLFAYSTFMIGLNAISRSRRERVVATPVSALMALSVFVIALGPGT